MKVRRVVVPMLVVLAVAVLVGRCELCRADEEVERPAVAAAETVQEPETTFPRDTRFVVIVPPEDGIKSCRVIPYERHMAGSRWVTFVNLSKEEIRIEISNRIADTTEPSTVVFLGVDDSETVRIRALETASVTYTVTSPPGGCFPELPTPRVIIP